MKSYVLLIIFGLQIPLPAQDWHDKWDRSGETWKEKWKNTFIQIEPLPAQEKIEILGEAVRAKSTQGGLIPREDQLEVGDYASQSILSIPGHAEYFRNKIENDRATILPKEPYLYGGDYDRNRRLAFEVLSHLPSPETIKVLGDYLDDERDAAKEAVWTSEYLLMGTSPNSRHAREALKNIGLRHADFAEPDIGKDPTQTNYATRKEFMHLYFNYLVIQRTAQLKAWRAWYAEVEQGVRTFSFKGQSVEYRFKPDGTWETTPITNPPNDGPKPAKPMMSEPERPEKRSTSVAVEQKSFSDRTIWGWAIFLALTTFIAVRYLRFRKTRRA